MDSENRNTFLTCAELLKEQIQRLEKICVKLRYAVATSPEPLQSALGQILEKEHTLSMCIEKFVQHGPSQLLHTRLQYTPDENYDSYDAENRLEKEDYSRVIIQLTWLNENISDQIGAAHQSMPNSDDEGFDSFDAFVLKVNSLCKDISMDIVTMHDV